jgi:hypothetical protein
MYMIKVFTIEVLLATFLDSVYDSFTGAPVPRVAANPSGTGDLSGATPAGIHEQSISLAAE